MELGRDSDTGGQVDTWFQKLKRLTLLHDFYAFSINECIHNLLS